MSVVELLERLDSREITEWGLFFVLRNEEQALRSDGLTEDEIADVIAGGQERGYELERDSPGLLDTLLGEEAAAERRIRLMQDEDALTDEEDED